MSLHAPQVIERSIGRNAAQPRPEAARPLESCARPVCTPEGLDDNVFGDATIADDTQSPAVHLDLKGAEQHFEGVAVAANESREQLRIGLRSHRLVYPALLNANAKGSIW